MMNDKAKSKLMIAMSLVLLAHGLAQGLITTYVGPHCCPVKCRIEPIG